MTTTAETTPETAQILEEVATTAQHQLDAIIKASQDQAEKASAQFLKGYEDIAAFNKETVDALVLSSSIAAKGIEDLSRQAADYARTAFDDSMALGNALLKVKSAQEALSLQNAYIKASFENAAAESARFQEQAVQVMTQSLAPLKARAKAAADQVAKALAA